MSNFQLSDLKIVPADAVLGSLRSRDGAIDVRKLTDQVEAIKDLKVGREFFGERLSSAKLVEAIVALEQEPEQLEAFAKAFAERAFIETGKIHQVGEEVSALLVKVAKAVRDIRVMAPSQCAPKSEELLTALEKVERQIFNFYAKATEERGFMDAADYRALNAQHYQIGIAIKSEERKFIGAVSERTGSKIVSKGAFTDREVAEWSETRRGELDKLVKRGVVRFSKESKAAVGIYVLAGANITRERFEELMPAPLRDALGRGITDELSTKYGGKLRPLGIGETREEGVPSLLDRRRARNIADKVGVSVSVVVLALKYFRDHGLLELAKPGTGLKMNQSVVDLAGWMLSSTGKKAGLGLGTVRLIQQQEAGDSQQRETAPEAPQYEQLFEAAAIVKQLMRAKTYQYETETGALPKTFVLNGLYLGSANMEPKTALHTFQEIENSPDGIVIAAEMLQGHPRANPEAMRSSITPELTGGCDLRDFENQIKTLSGIIGRFNKPFLLSIGSRELESSKVYADILRERIKSVQDGNRPGSEQEVEEKLAAKNEISLRAARKRDPKQYQGELLKFVYETAVPFAIKLGRGLLESGDVEQSCGIKMSELEIVRDMAHLLRSDKKDGGTAGLDTIDQLYGDFITKLGGGKPYLQLLQEVIDPSKESFQKGSVIARPAANIQLVTPEHEGLLVHVNTDASYGKALGEYPLKSIRDSVNSRATNGNTVEDVHIVAATRRPELEITGTGTLLISAGTMEAADFDREHYYSSVPDANKRRRKIQGGENFATGLSVWGGVHRHATTGELVKTCAYGWKMITSKQLDVIDNNLSMGKPYQLVESYIAGDHQIGSPTAREYAMVFGYLTAINRGCKNICPNGDLFHGGNYLRHFIECLLSENPLGGVEDQQRYVAKIFEEILFPYMLEKKRKDPSWEPPIWLITAGNHETNSQSMKGLQGTWFLGCLASQLETFYSTWRKFDPSIKESSHYVRFARKYDTENGTPVDYSHTVIDETETTGFRHLLQHYVGVGAKGSSRIGPISAFRNWIKSRENSVRSIHSGSLQHWHTFNASVEAGIPLIIFPADADQSGFEHHLGYTDTVPGSGLVRYQTNQVPEYFVMTEAYMKLSEQKMVQESPFLTNLYKQYGSLEGKLAKLKAHISRREDGAYSYQKQKYDNGLHEPVQAIRPLKRRTKVTE
jgi:hypothetical protein